MRKVAVFFVVMQLLLFPLNSVANNLDSKVPEAHENIKADLLKNSGPKQSIEKETDYLDPINYPIIEEGDLVGYLLDSHYTYHTIYYESITTYSNNPDKLQVKLLYASDDTYLKDSILTMEFYNEENSTLSYLGNFEFNVSQYDAVYLNAQLYKEYFYNQPYIYMRVGISKTVYDTHYSDVKTFKVKNPFFTSNEQSEDDQYMLISNESTNGNSSQSTGTFNLGKMEYYTTKKLNQSAYKIDVNIPFDFTKNKENLVQKENKFLDQSYVVGDIKYFWVTNLINNSNYQIDAKLAYSGTKANVWVHNEEITDIDAEELGKEFDTQIYPSVVDNFAVESDVDGDGKINILCYDIRDGFYGSGGYVAGYFWSGDLYNVSGSNKSEVFYIDTYPTMGSSSAKNVNKAYDTLAHEFQHMVNFNQNVLVEGGRSMDTWLNEALSMAAEQIYSGRGLTDRLNYYNASTSIQNGHSLLYWDNSGDVLSNYSLSYLFGQYIRIQSNQGDHVFKEILTDSNNDYRAVENVARKYINSNLSFGKLMTNFRTALLLKESTGMYGFKGNPFFDALEVKLFNGNYSNLRGGGAIVSTHNSEEDWVNPIGKGQDVTFTLLNMEPEDEVDITPPDKPVVNGVNDQDTQITGRTEPNATVYAKVGHREIGRAEDISGPFVINISPQQAGGIIEVFAEDKSGNVSMPTKVTVVDVTPPKAPIVNRVTDQSTSITGSAEAKAEITVIIGSEVKKGTVTTDGKFNISVPKQKAGTRITVKAKDAAGNVSAETKVTVVDVTPPKAPIVNQITNKSTIITGTADRGTKVIAKVSGRELGRATVDNNNKFQISIVKQAEGTTIDVVAVDSAGNISPSTKIKVNKKQTKLEKLIGSTRYSTAVEVSKLGWNTSNKVYLVNGSAIADGLTATPLASANKAPILLTKKDTIPSETMKDLQRLKSKEIVLIGGKNVISSKVEKTLSSKGYSVSRIGGVTRYETSLLIAQELDKIVDVNTVYVAYGFGEPDALSIAAQAGKTNQPILLTEKNKVPEKTYTWLKKEGLQTSYFVGGKNVIGQKVVSEMNGVTSLNVSNNRLNGSDRHMTNVEVIKKFYKQTDMSAILVAHSQTEKLVDALTAGPLAAKLNVPVLLVPDKGLNITQINILKSKNTNKVQQIGGGLKSDVLNRIVELMN